MAVRNDKPNIVTILADQYRYDALSFRGNPVVKTPNLDKLASGGAFFSNAICTSPLCGPSRASLLTGMYPSGHGFHRNAEVFEDGMSEKLETIDEILKCNGYSTHYFGKWHTGRTHRDCYVGGLPYYLDYYKGYLDSKYPFTGLKSGQKVDRYTGREYDADPIDDMMAGSKERGMKFAVE
jgi:arylsulfatase A-like enzyme